MILNWNNQKLTVTKIVPHPSADVLCYVFVEDGTDTPYIITWIELFQLSHWVDDVCGCNRSMDADDTSCPDHRGLKVL